MYTARAEAIRLSGELLRDIGAKFWNGTEWKLIVADEHGRTLFVPFFREEGRIGRPSRLSLLWPSGCSPSCHHVRRDADSSG